jgi:hypothetical protein
MKNTNKRTLTGLLATAILACSFSAQATAPRITPKLFGEEQKADIVGYEPALVDTAAKSKSALAVDIITQAYKAEGKTPTIDVLPSKQLATYALINNDAQALIGNMQDLASQDKKLYRAVTFYPGAFDDKPVALIFSRAHGNELHQAFNEGLQKIVKNGAYLTILQKYHVKAPGDYASRLKRLNPGWK